MFINPHRFDDRRRPNRRRETPWNPRSPGKPTPENQCVLYKPLHLWIPPGQTVTIPCPVHGSHELHGNVAIYC